MHCSRDDPERRSGWRDAMTLCGLLADRGFETRNQPISDRGGDRRLPNQEQGQRTVEVNRQSRVAAADKGLQQGAAQGSYDDRARATRDRAELLAYESNRQNRQAASNQTAEH